MRKRLLSVAAVTVLLAAAGLADAQDRRLSLGQDVPPVMGRKVALVIGNNTYPTQPLRNAVPDALAVTAALKGLGFEVTPLNNVGLAAMEREIDRFANGLTTNDVALFFYSGHGMQVENVNYLVPVDFTGQDQYDVKAKAVSADRVHEKLQGAGTRILILDACRDNPFKGTRSAAKGLADMAGRGSLIAYAAGPGETAADVGIKPDSRNGLFTEQLLDVLAEPGLTAVELFRKVRQRVSEASAGKQFPWLSDGLLQDFVFKPGLRIDPNNTGSLLVMCDRDCAVAVDGQTLGNVAAGQSISVPTLVGQHQVTVTHRVPTGDSLSWQKVVSLDSPVQMLVETDLTTPYGAWVKEQERLAELKRQEEARIAAELKAKQEADALAAKLEAERIEQLRLAEIARQQEAAAAKALKDAEFYKTVAGKWMRDVEEQQGSQNKTRTEDVVMIELTCAGVLNRTITYYERGFSGWKKVRSEPSQLTFQCDGDGNLNGALTGQIMPVPAQNAVSIGGAAYARGR